VIEFRQWLLTKKPIGRGLADNTTRRTIGIAKQFLQRAVKAKLIVDNPFRDEELPTSTTGNKTREHFVTRAEAELEACPKAEWRLIFALSRYGGLRCPSEHVRLRWSDVDWDRDRITIHASKTEHHTGRGVRVMPLFPELRSHLPVKSTLDGKCRRASHYTTSWIGAPCSTRYCGRPLGSSNVVEATSMPRFLYSVAMMSW